MVYARARTQVRRSHFLGRVGGWKAGNNRVRRSPPVRRRRHFSSRGRYA